jgi:membrane protein DedA with SNARE-associated domain
VISLVFGASYSLVAWFVGADISNPEDDQPMWMTYVALAVVVVPLGAIVSIWEAARKRKATRQLEA